MRNCPLFTDKWFQLNIFMFFVAHKIIIIANDKLKMAIVAGKYNGIIHKTV